MSFAPLFPERYDPIRWWSRVEPARTAVVDADADRRLSYAELDAYADRWAASLQRSGIGDGDRVAVLAGSRLELVALFYACVRVGAALVPLNWRLAPAELAAVLDNARPSLYVVDARFHALAEAASPAADWRDLDDARLPSAPSYEPAPTPPDAAALILYTSGSTGRPKGVVLPHRQIFYNAVATCTAWQLGTDDVAPVSTPLFHTGGWNVLATPLWHAGGRVVLLERFDAATFLGTLAREACTIALTVPTQLVMLIDAPDWGRPLPALRRFMVGGAPCSAALAERVRAAGYELREGYGLTECGPNCFAISRNEASARPGAVGRPVPFLEARLCNDAGHDMPDREIGELWLRGPQMFAGYFADPVQTAAAVTADGWLRTGDLARRDEAGAYYICGRRKEMYISGGENVFPAEIEAVIATCAGVAETAVIGMPDERWGEVGVAFVVAAPGVVLDEAAVITHARAHLARYKVPKRVVLLADLPRLGSGKIDRGALLQRIPEEIA
jgi:fatty-acyl-CoA synthase